MQSLEIVGTVLGLLNLWLTLRQNIWCWPVGIACVLCFIFVFVDARLYSDALLQVIYVGLQLYGWWFWATGSHLGFTSTEAIQRLTNNHLAGWLVGIAIAALSLGTVMAKFTKADLPYLDALPTVISIAAAWLQAKKVLESWLFFITANIIFIGVYAAKGLYVTIALYVASTALAIAGFITWRRLAAVRANIIPESSN